MTAPTSKRYQATRAYRALYATAIQMPVDLFAELYLAAPPQTQERIEQHYGITAVDRLVERYDQQAAA
ncbi:MAG: hypothetical protein EOO27_14890 [Comamonadaceae bacterium]|jgi:hypothetical protein|nr:MAG: hypothetical protein EOO27_14890 [Comamonadaceae bacterium]